MRIIAGRFRGKQLMTPGDESIRPTADRVRESIFDILSSRLGPSFDGMRVLDLFAGTGALGLEALSRGAASAVFVETGAEARGLIRDHIEAFGLGGTARLLRRDATALGPSGTMGAFDLVFLDPPYREPIEPWLELVAPVLATGARIYVERPLPPGLPATVSGDWIKRSRAGGVEFGLVVLDRSVGGSG